MVLLPLLVFLGFSSSFLPATDAVFGATLAAISILVPPASVVTGPMVAGMGTSVATGATVGAATAVGSAASVAATTAAGAAAGATGATIVGTAAGTTGALVGAVNLAMGPPGWIVLGASSEEPDQINNSSGGSPAYRWDCWRPILHDDKYLQVEKMTIASVLNHPAVVNVSKPDWDGFMLTNDRDETFKIVYVQLHDGSLAAHADRVF